MSVGLQQRLLGCAERAGPLVVRVRPDVGGERQRHSRRRRRLRRRAKWPGAMALAPGDFPQAIAGAYPPFVLAGGRRVNSLAKIPVTVITGFLGSGKTTLIRH